MAEVPCISGAAARMEEAFDQGVQLGVVRAHRGLGLDPRRLALDRSLRVTRFDP